MEEGEGPRKRDLVLLQNVFGPPFVPEALDPENHLEPGLWPELRPT